MPIELNIFTLSFSSQDTALDLDWSSSLYTAQGLMELQRLFGPVPTIRGIGASAEAVADSLSRIIDTAGEESSALGSFQNCTEGVSNVAFCDHLT